MKYIDADKIRAEIERLYGEYKDKFHRSGDSYHLGLIDGLDMAERALDTLEEPVSEDLPMPEDTLIYRKGVKEGKRLMMEDAVEGTLEGQLLKSLTEDGKKMIISVPRSVFPSKPITRKIRVIIVKEEEEE